MDNLNTNEGGKSDQVNERAIQLLTSSEPTTFTGDDVLIVLKYLKNKQEEEMRDGTSENGDLISTARDQGLFNSKLEAALIEAIRKEAEEK